MAQLYLRAPVTERGSLHRDGARVELFGLGSGAALAAVVGVLVKVPTMLLLMDICKKTKHLFPQQKAALSQPATLAPQPTALTLKNEASGGFVGLDAGSEQGSSES